MGCCNKSDEDVERDEDAVVDESQELSKKCKWLKFGCGCLKVEINPLVTFLSAVAIWSAVIVCMVRPVESLELLKPWMPWITKTWTWLYMATQDIWFFVIAAAAFMKYGNIKLGKDNEKPEYSNASYFCMLFAAGIGIGLIYYGVAEPVYHYKPGKDGHRYYERYNDNQAAQDAMFITYFHYGIHAWVVYVMVGLVMGLASYRFGLTMSIRSCFYPIIGEHIYGIIGDLIDSLSVVCTMFGVCTSLGLGTMQLGAGLNRLNPNIPNTLLTHIIVIWAITAVATVSVVSGVKVGIRRISEVCFVLGMFLLITILFMDDTWYLLNNYVQSTGYYIQNVIQIGFWCDTFSQLNNSMDGRDSPTWIGSWTIFYWGWWIAWAPFVGMFIAKVSRGRTVREFVMYTLTAPTLYGFFWFAVFGGVGIKMEREAFHANITCDSAFGGTNATMGGPNGTDRGLFRLSCRASTDMFFDVMMSYPGVGYFMSAVSVASLVLYFVTSSDSGSLVIDSLSANGHPDPPRLQRIFWALTEGGCATGLLIAGGNDALSALQTVSIAAGLIYTILLNFMAVALWRFCKIDAGELDPNGPTFNCGICDILYSIRKLGKTALALVAPWYFYARANAWVNRSNKCAEIATHIILAVLFYGWIALLVLQIVLPGLDYIGWTIYVGWATWCCGIRLTIRDKFAINGNMAEDFFAVLLLYPFAAVQLDDHMTHATLPDEDADDAKSAGSYNLNNNPEGLSENGIAIEEKPSYPNQAFSNEDEIDIEKAKMTTSM